MNDRRRRTAQSVWMAVLVSASSLMATENTLVLSPEATEVSFDLDATGHDIHGLIGLQSGEIRFDPATGVASGRIVLDARDAATGNSSRDKTLRDDVFEIARFPEIVFEPSRIEGAIPASGHGSVTLRGTIRLHGVDHPLDLPTELTVEKGRVDALAKITIPYQEWGLHDPSILFLRVAKVVSVSIHVRGELATGAQVAAVSGR